MYKGIMSVSYEKKSFIMLTTNIKINRPMFYGYNCRHFRLQYKIHISSSEQKCGVSMKIIKSIQHGSKRKVF